MIFAHILLCAAFILFSIDYDSYDVDNEEQVTELHNVLSSDVHRAEIEIACGCIWASFPLHLIALYGIRKMTASIMEGTSAEMFVYLAEKAYIVLLTVLTVVLPALM